TFYVPASLKSVTVTGGNVLRGAFQNCTGLTGITIPDCVTTIGASAFSGCTALKTISLPDSVRSIGVKAFNDTACYNRLQNWKGGTLYIGRHLIEVKPDTVGAFALRADTVCVADQALAGCRELTAVDFPEGLRAIGTEALKGCAKVTALAVPDSVEAIGAGAFNGCAALQEITLPFVGGSRKTAADDDQYPFGYVFGTASYTGGTATSQTYLKNGASGDAATASYRIPTALTAVTVTGGEILRGAFQNCKNLTEIRMPEVAVIHPYAFSGCAGLAAVTLPAGLTELSKSAFAGCSKVKDVTLPATLAAIDEYAFLNWSGLETIYFCGTEAAWDEVVIQSRGNSSLMQADLVFGFSPKAVAAVALTHAPEKTVYRAGEALDLTGLVLTATHYDGTESAVTAGFLLSGYDPAKTGEQTVTVSYEGKAVSFTVLVRDPVSPEDPAAARVVVKNGFVQPGARTVVTVWLENNPGMAILELTPVLPEGVTLVGVTVGSVFSTLTGGSKQLILDAGSANIAENGLILSLTLEAADSMQEGSYALEMIVRSCRDHEEAPVPAAAVAGVLTVASALYGDANGDGVIDTADVVRLMNYLAHYNFATGESAVEIAAGADANGSGKVDTADLIRLKNYLANLDYDTGESTVPLGPAA
ncbi:MAG: leucine-rich repeat protein, partial [Clostridia bacterium]|nr:leucine-rich repeat protein [Clostridia bacterium]